MARAVISQDVYDRLLAAYREAPGNVMRAARLAGCGIVMARKSYYEGWPKSPWAVKISLVLEREKEEARFRLVKEQEEERKRNEQVKEAVRQDAIKARTEEGVAVRVARQNAINILAVTNKITVGALRLADVMKDALEKAKSGDLDPLKGAVLIERVVRAARQAGELAHRAVVMERLVLGQPTEILGISDMGDSTTIEEDLAEIERANEDKDRYLRTTPGAEKLRLVPGGKDDPPPPPPPPTGTEGA